MKHERGSDIGNVGKLPFTGGALAWLALVASVATVLALPARATPIPFAGAHAVDASFGGAEAVYAADVDGDGDVDVLGAAFHADDITWWENTARDGSAWTEHTIAGGFDGANSVHAADVDGDGDLDVLGAAELADDIAWWENTAGDGTAWTRHTVDANFDGARSVYAEDVDGDGDVDVLGAAVIADDITWWENRAGDGSAWTKRTLAGSFNGALSVYATDLDGDGDVDVLGAASIANDVAWWENTAGDGSAWVKRTVVDGFDGARSVRAADVDGDGDVDVLGAASVAHELVWWENVAGDGSVWTERVVGEGLVGASAVHATDVDGDGDIDVLGAARGANDIVWWENVAGDGSAWSAHVVDPAFEGAIFVYAADVDGDGDVDVLGAAREGSDITWWENETIHRSALHPVEHAVDADFAAATSAYTADVDGDGDMDVLGAGSRGIRWWENAAGDGTAWSEHTVDSDFAGAESVHAADVDGDGDVDVLGAALVAGDITWWENTAGDGSFWVGHDIDASFVGAIAVHAADVDGDGDVDVLGAALSGDSITWWENTTGDGTIWIEHSIEDGFDGAVSVYAVDVDGDGDVDILGAALVAGDITWWENTAADGSRWTEHPVATAFGGARSTYAADVDGDGDVDILGAALSADDITWWENTAGDGSAWTEHPIDANFDGARSAYALDVDGDGDVDVLGATLFADHLTWWENSAGDGSAWAAHEVDASFTGVHSVYAADVDGDGDADVLGAASQADGLHWWENRGGQFALVTTDDAPAGLEAGDRAEILAITMAHRGRMGDSDEELATLELRIDDGSGAPLPSDRANALIENLEIYRDDGTGTFEESGDARVAVVATLSLDAAGTQTVTFADGAPGVQVVHGVDPTFFVVVQATADGHLATPDTFRLTHVTEASSTAEDSSADIRLGLEFAPNATSATVQVTRCGDALVEAGEECDDGGTVDGDCCSSTCSFEAAGNSCGDLDARACSRPDTCDGSGSCLENHNPAGSTCRPAAGACDAAEVCDGVSGSCPVDRIVGAGVLCRAGSGDLCDPDEVCDGVATSCPVDTVTAAGALCEAGDICRLEATCSGAAGEACAGAVDVADGTECDDGEICTPEAQCLSGACTPITFEPDGTACADGDSCTDAQCVDAVCTTTTAVDCDDGDLCTRDTCDSATGCTHAASPVPTCEEGFEKGLLLIKESTPGKEKLVAKLVRGPALTQTDLGDPLVPGGTAYGVCIYDDRETLVGSMTVDRAGSACAGKECWKPIGKSPPEGKGYLYKDKETSADGIQRIKLKGGDAGRSLLLIQGKNDAAKGQLDLPAGMAAGLSASTRATVQIVGSDLGSCLSMTLDEITKQEPDVFQARR